MQVIKIKDDYIKLGQLIKLAGFADNGVEAKYYIQNSLVLVNGQIDTRRGKKVVPGDIVSFKGKEVRVEANDN
ncbi:MAG: RNA-binding S4 domain-containing protein [Catonella sp.]|uniref:RNA-binding S4 domain-containing protein n=1 Tax=Catonella sp. TaxID=2382125 RepID=UPI003FA0817E